MQFPFLPVVSVLTPCFNGAEFLRESIESVLAQSFRDFEYLLVDDGSSDDTLTIMKSFAASDPRIVVLCKSHSGLTDSLNFGLQRARGEWIARLDADDMAMPERLERQLSLVQKNPEIILAGSGLLEMDRAGNLVRKRSYPRSHVSLMKCLEHMKRFFPHSSAFFSKRRALDLGGYHPRMLGAEDWDLWLRMGRAGKIGCLREPLVKTRRHADSISNYNGGKTQQISGVAAAVCHLYRKSGHSDPSQMEPGKWQQFLNWLQNQPQFEAYFQTLIAREALRATWYDDSENGGMSRMKRLGRFARSLTAEPRSMEILLQTFRGTDLAFRLAGDSTHIFQESFARLE
jgi:glycosyltransferase involved in cell wall biosynthesis